MKIIMPRHKSILIRFDMKEINKKIFKSVLLSNYLRSYSHTKFRKRNHKKIHSIPLH